MSEMENLFSDSIEYNADDLEMFEKQVLWRESSYSMAFIHIQCLESNLCRALSIEQTLSDCVFSLIFSWLFLGLLPTQLFPKKDVQ